MQSNYDVIVVGAGPAGLGAAIEARRCGASVLLLDENSRPGGQLFKQIHKFFGSEEHYAGTRGFMIGENLLKEAAELGVETKLSTRVWGVYPDGSVAATDEKQSWEFKAKRIVLASGASENALSFPGCTLPGVITAGAAQTFMNVQHVVPGKRFVVVGSGNVGLIVTYQLLQAGADVACILEAAPGISGYAVHAAKVKRAGVPVRTSHTILRAEGNGSVERVVVAKLDEKFKPIPGTEETIECDTVAIAVGLTPRVEIANVSGCKLVNSGPLGVIPAHTSDMETTVDNLLVAGDAAGIEEASTALDEGRLAGTRAAYKLGFLTDEEYEAAYETIMKRLNTLRAGPFGERRRLLKEAVWNSMK